MRNFFCKIRPGLKYPLVTLATLFVLFKVFAKPEIFRVTQLPSNIFPLDASYHHVDICKKPFIIENSNLCSGRKHLAHIVLVHSAASNFARRQSLRETWANPKVLTNVTSRTVFILGKPKSKEIQLEILEENRKYGDIVQGDFVDHYDNLTLKAVTGLRWISEHCRNSLAVIKVDDDIFVDIGPAVKKFIPTTQLHPRRLICNAIQYGPVYRRETVGEPNVKWTVPDEVFPGLTQYPMPFCLGMAVFMSTELTENLWMLSKSTPFFRMDDVFVYGIVASKVPGITWQNEDYNFFKATVNFKFFGFHYIISTTESIEDMKYKWSGVSYSYN